jgi:hypothetical protein
MRKPLLAIVLVAALAGFLFASFSTFDFVQHLDRQVHGLHCSFVPGFTGTDVSGASGCHVALMSPYSSLFRTAIWGGLPISLPAMAVFTFLACRALVAILRKGDNTSEVGWLAVAAVIPVLASIVMAGIAVSELGTFCKLCVGIYTASAVGFGAALAAFFSAPSAPTQGEADYLSYMAPPSGGPGGGAGAIPAGGAPTAVPIDVPPDLYDSPPQDVDDDPFSAGFAVAQGFGFVILPVILYAVLAPDFSRYTGKCGVLKKPEDPYGVMLKIGGGGKSSAIEVFDPLCPSCKALEERLDASGLVDELDRRLVLFPLDATCNWMVGQTIHAGACTISEAVACADKDARKVIDWAFENQEEIRTRAAEEEGAAESMVLQKFPQLEGCVGSAKVKSQINKSLRWAVANQLQVLTPQLYVRGAKLCDEDTDLGLDYSLRRLLNEQAGNPQGSADGGAGEEAPTVAGERGGR